MSLYLNPEIWYWKKMFDVVFLYHSGHSEVVKLLLEYGSDIEHRNKAGCTPLMLAARYGSISSHTIKLLNRPSV